MNITAEMVKDLREKTGAGVLDCRKALSETAGEMTKAVEYLRKKGLAAAAKKIGRTAAEGQVVSYIHAGGKIGVLLEVNCETDFVARTDEFKNFIRDIAMHVAASSPQYVRREEVPQDILDAEKEIYRSQAQESKKPPQVVEKMILGKIEKFFSEVCLLEQPFVKEPEKTVQSIATELTAKLGENIVVRRFARFQLGEGIEKKADNFQEEVAKQLAG